ncbi:D-alanine--D-alanine ligase family protein [Nocardia altamirensis]|uniref:D-alanine--D-alanine ligase family protein n=1 Tax=Nocardia altamirensis TaxID=472158 RepID=UPI000A0347E5|nr:ATP-grasp domain-containing protein [Nocardia altamirensis]
MLGGGESNERAVSAASGAAVASAFRSLGYAVDEVDPAVWPQPAAFDAHIAEAAPPESEAKRLEIAFRSTMHNDAFLGSLDGDVVFLALHGGIGESGELKALLEARGIPSTGVGSAAMALSWNKIDTIAALAAAAVPVPRSPLPDQPLPDGANWIVKPALGGSSLEVYRCGDAGEVEAAIARIEGPVLVEEFLPGPEFTVGIVGAQALPPVLIEPGEGWFGYEAKYQIGRSREICPAPIDDALTDQLLTLARKSTAALGFGDNSYARVDMMLDAAGTPRVLEVNSLPGLAKASLLPLAARAAGWSFPTLCQEIVRLAG